VFEHHKGEDNHGCPGTRELAGKEVQETLAFAGLQDGHNLPVALDDVLHGLSLKGGSILGSCSVHML
jgi:hypothetical protein